MQEIKCPNCGAPAKNHKNCEFCGSLLVRFANKGIDLTSTTYLNNDAVLPGLIKHLEKNLELQPNADGVITDIYYENEERLGGIAPICSVITAKKATDYDGNLYFPDSETPSLGLVFGFSIFSSEIEALDPERGKERVKKEKFEQLVSYSLFESRVLRQIDNTGLDYFCYEYAIDFGQDAEGAARLISEIANKVYGRELNKPLIYSTNADEKILEARNKLKGLSTSTEDSDISEDSTIWDSVKKWIWFVIAAIGILLSLIL